MGVVHMYCFASKLDTCRPLLSDYVASILELDTVFLNVCAVCFTTFGSVQKWQISLQSALLKRTVLLEYATEF